MSLLAFAIFFLLVGHEYAAFIKVDKISQIEIQLETSKDSRIDTFLSLEFEKTPCSAISVLYANIMGHYAFDLERKNLTMMMIEPESGNKIPYMKPDITQEIPLKEVKQ